MAAKSILVVGKVVDQTTLITNAFIMGYRVLCIENLWDRLAILNQEDIRLIIIYKIDSRMGDQTLVDLIKSRFPVILAREGKIRDIIEGYQDQMSVLSRRSGSKERVNVSLKRFFNGEQEEVEEDCCLSISREKDIVFLKLSGGGNAQITQNRIKRQSPLWSRITVIGSLSTR